MKKLKGGGKARGYATYFTDRWTGRIKAKDTDNGRHAGRCLFHDLRPRGGRLGASSRTLCFAFMKGRCTHVLRRVRRLHRRENRNLAHVGTSGEGRREGRKEAFRLAYSTETA